jgi:hypothetical protein
MTELIMPRRQFLKGLIGLVAAPAVVKAANIMPVKVMPPELVVERYAFREVALGYSITRKEVDDVLWNTQNDWMHRALTESFQQTKEICAANMLDGSSGLLVKTIKVLRSS